MNEIMSYPRGRSVIASLKQSLAHILFGQKGGENRVQILKMLRDRPYNLNQMAEKLDLNYRTIQHHMTVLRDHGLVCPSTSGGYGEVYFLAPELEQNIAVLDELVQKMKDITASPKFFQTVIEKTSDAVVIIDASGSVLFWNKGAENATGHAGEDVVGESIPMFRDAGFIPAAIKRLAEGKKVAIQETKAVHKNGALLDFEVTIDAIDNPDGNTVAHIIMARDVGERKRAEEELGRMREQLVRQEKLAMLGQMAGGVGHELYNPLATMKNAAYFLDMALDSPEPDVRETIDILKGETAASERIIRALLDFARAGPSDWKRIDLNVSVQNALANVPVPSNVRVVKHLARGLPQIAADPTLLEVAFRNIILNAVQAMPDGGSLTVSSLSPNPKTVAVSVADDGAGISAENVERIFDPLFTTKAKGIGLGLPLAKKMIDAHGGSIDVKNGERRGCTFTVRIPTNGGEYVETKKR